MNLASLGLRSAIFLYKPHDPKKLHTFKNVCRVVHLSSFLNYFQRYYIIIYQVFLIFFSQKIYFCVSQKN